MVLIVLLALRAFAPGLFDLAASSLWSFGTTMTQQFEKDPSTSVQDLQTRIEELSNENEVLKARLQDVGAARELPSETGLLAGVLSRPPVSPYDVLVVDQGTNAGAQEGMVAYAQGVPIGTVAEANARTSRVLLYSSPERFTEGWVGEQRLPLTLIGGGAGTFEADVARELEVAEGDMVYVPGPGALPIGRVERIESHASSPRSVLRIRPLVNPLALTFVRLVQ